MTNLNRSFKSSIFPPFERCSCIAFLSSSIFLKIYAPLEFSVDAMAVLFCIHYKDTKLDSNIQTIHFQEQPPNHFKLLSKFTHSSRRKHPHPTLFKSLILNKSETKRFESCSPYPGSIKTYSILGYLSFILFLIAPISSPSSSAVQSAGNSTINTNNTSSGD